MADVFVSYSRRDSEFVRRLAEAVSQHGKEVWLDTEGIADAEVFPDAIKRAIEQSNAFLFVITPASVASPYCEHELEYARDLQKRIVPVLRDPVSDAELPAEIRDRDQGREDLGSAERPDYGCAEGGGRGHATLRTPSVAPTVAPPVAGARGARVSGLLARGGGGLENRCRSYWPTESSNLSPSAASGQPRPDILTSPEP
jgi:TIR domain